jgi:hypothetical protein
MSGVEEEGGRQGECRSEIFGGGKFHKDEGDKRDLDGKQNNLIAYPSNSRMTTQELCPPKPKELLSATFTLLSRAV